ncbi:MAG TPA: 16S rRNA (cytosine(967)-C(5))-methyltransferase RsmB [Candidatus Limnocylindrales bacterium]|jgi:16S rRNA (cytosine967-C5)-methyltransferase|nr:16S rRNA (cytosine(967)-C(5))-methyltransferase RsmB [Candidatus Limnocylindrales bacterium]
MPVSPARAAAFDILLRVEQQDAYASELLHSERLDTLSLADRGLTTEIVMGVLRWRSRLDDAIAAQSSRPLGKLDPQVLTALRIAAYQLLYLSRVPARAAINESVDLVKRAHKVSAAPFANAVLRKLANTKPETVAANTSATTAALLAHEFAHPEWLVERWVDHLGIDNVEGVCRHDQRIPTTSIRLDGAAVEGELKNEGIELAPGTLLTAARIVTSGDVTQTRAYREGRVFIQDEASQLVAALVGTGSRLLDCCAAPGSKTAAIASRNPAAEIVAVELHPHRAELLRRRVRATNVQVITADTLHIPLKGGFDGVLADVPCSGTGTLARNPEIKWRLKPADLGELHSKQVAILRAALQQLTPGGRAVYSTCSLESEENQAVVEEVLQGDSKFTLLNCRTELERLRAEGELAISDLDSLLEGKYLRTLPGVHPCDGFFAAIIQRLN